MNDRHPQFICKTHRKNSIQCSHALGVQVQAGMPSPIFESGSNGSGSTYRVFALPEYSQEAWVRPESFWLQRNGVPRCGEVTSRRMTLNL
jgi:hypothetical protein